MLHRMHLGALVSRLSVVSCQWCSESVVGGRWSVRKMGFSRSAFRQGLYDSVAQSSRLKARYAALRNSPNRSRR